MVDECPNVHVWVGKELVEKIRKKLNLHEKMPANYVVDTGLRELLDVLEKTEPEVKVVEQPTAAQ